MNDMGVWQFKIGKTTGWMIWASVNMDDMGAWQFKIGKTTGFDLRR